MVNKGLILHWERRGPYIFVLLNRLLQQRVAIVISSNARRGHCRVGRWLISSLSVSDSITLPSLQCMVLPIPRTIMQLQVIFTISCKQSLMKPQEEILSLGIYNMQVGKDSDTWASKLGKFGVRKMNRNGQLPLEFATVSAMVISDSLFHQP